MAAPTEPDETEARFRAMISSPLLLQQPLEAVLELLFGTLRAQGAAIADLQSRLRDASQAAAAAGESRDAAVRSLAAELAAHQAEAAADQLRQRQRVTALELRLHGASNLAGRHAALDEIASIVGVDVRQVGLPPAALAQAAATDQAAVAAAEAAEAAAEASLHGQEEQQGGGGAGMADSFVHSGGSATGTPRQPSFTAAGAVAEPTAQQQAEASTADGTASTAVTAPEGASLPPSGGAGQGLGRGGSAAAAVGMQQAAPSVPRTPSAAVFGAAPATAASASTFEPHHAAPAAASPRSPRIELPSLAGLFAAMQVGKSKAGSPRTAERPGSAAPPAGAAKPAGRQSPQQPSSRTGSQGGAAACQPAGSPASEDLAPPAAGGAAGSPASDGTAPAPSSVALPTASAAQEGQGGAPSRPASAARPPSSARARLLEVLASMRGRTSLKEGGLLWKLQASLAEAVTDQERLQGEVALLQGELRALHDAQSAGLERCATGLDRCSGRIDAVESSVGAAHTWIERQAAAGGGPALPPALPLEPGVAPAEFKALEARVDEDAQRIGKLDSAAQAAAEASASAARLVRASSSGSSADTMAALQGHLSAQQQKLQAQMDALASGLRSALPGQVAEAVAGAAGDIGRRLGERLASKHDLQTVSAKVSSKVSREEVERMLRAHRAAQAPPSPSAADAAGGPAAGMRFKCISCDTDLQPFIFAAAPGALGGGTTADLRYSHLPVASPARNAGQPWTAAVAGGAAPVSPTAELSRASSAGDAGSLSPGGAHVLPPSPLSGRPSTAASRGGAPASWLHRMRRETGGSDGAPVSRRESAASGGAPAPESKPSLTTLALCRPQTAAPAALGGGGGEAWGAGPLRGAADRGASEWSEVIGPDVSPSMAGGSDAGDKAVARSGGSPVPGGSKAALPALPSSPGGRIKAARPSTALPGGGSSTSPVGQGSAAAAAAAAARRNSTLL